MKKILLISAVSLAIAGCGTVASKVVSDGTLQNKTAFAYGVNAEDVSILSQSGGLYDVKWTADVSGETVQCYMSSAIVVSSDAICSKGTKLKRNCNALLSAANMCDEE